MKRDSEEFKMGPSPPLPLLPLPSEGQGEGKGGENWNYHENVGNDSPILTTKTKKLLF